MKLITIGSDRRLFEEGSDVSRRALEQSALLRSHIIIVFAKRGLGLRPRRLGERVRVVPTNSISRFFYIPDAIRIGLREGKEATLITTQDPFEAGLTGFILARRLRLSLLVQVHADLFSPHFRSGSFLARIRVLLARFVLPRADCLRVVSERIKRSLQGRLRRVPPIAVLPVFSRLRKSGIAGTLPPTPFILVASRLEREKSVDAAIRAFARIASEFPDLLLTIAGEGKERPSLEALARLRGVADRVVFLGWRNDVPLLMERAALYLHTSPSEGFGLSLLEAARVGCPIVSTDVGIIGEIIPREDITIIPIGDVEGVAARLRSALLSGDSAPKACRLRDKLPQPLLLDEYLEKLSNTWTLCGTGNGGIRERHESR